MIENLTYQVVKVVNNMFDLKPKWTAAAMLDVLKNAFQLMEGVPREYWEAEVMCKVNHAIRDAASNYSHKREYSAIAELRRRLMVEFDLNLGAKGYGRSVKEGMTIWKAPCTSAEFIRALASIVQSDAGRKANLEKYNEASEGSQVKAVQQGGVLGKRKYEGGRGASKQGNDNNAKKKQNSEKVLSAIDAATRGIFERTAMRRSIRMVDFRERTPKAQAKEMVITREKATATIK